MVANDILSIVFALSACMAEGIFTWLNWSGANFDM